MKMSSKSETVLIIGASPKEDRYSNKAQKMLIEYGHKVVLVSPKGEDILGVKPYKNLSEIKEKIDTVTMYVSSKHSADMGYEILRLNPQRVIFNPGTESPELQNELLENGISIKEACTLVLLRTNQY
jgi:predicted CoA-binding protein